MSQAPIQVEPPEVTRLLALATELLRSGRTADAISPLRQAALMQPTNSTILHDLGLACLEVGRVPDAVAALRAAVASNPRYADAYFRLGIALEKLGNISGAIVAYDRATQLLPSLTEAWFRAGDLVSTLGHRDEAIACFRRAADTGGKTSFARLGKARALPKRHCGKRWSLIPRMPWRTTCWAMFSQNSDDSMRPAPASNAQSRSHLCWREATTIWSDAGASPAMMTDYCNRWKPL